MVTRLSSADRFPAIPQRALIIMPSPVYRLFRDAIIGRKQITCHYQGFYRELCPHILGHTKGQEIALTYQFAGQSRRGLPRGGGWKCLRLSEISDARLRDGPWHTGSSHTRYQPCVQIVEFDVNPSSPYTPPQS